MKSLRETVWQIHFRWYPWTLPPGFISNSPLSSSFGRDWWLASNQWGTNTQGWASLWNIVRFPLELPCSEIPMIWSCQHHREFCSIQCGLSGYLFPQVGPQVSSQIQPGLQPTIKNLKQRTPLGEGQTPWLIETGRQKLQAHQKKPHNVSCSMKQKTKH